MSSKNNFICFWNRLRNGAPGKPGTRQVQQQPILDTKQRTFETLVLCVECFLRKQETTAVYLGYLSWLRCISRFYVVS